MGATRGSIGIDGVSWKEYGERLYENINDLVARLKAKWYKPQPSRRVYIYKDEHSKGPFGLPALKDKIVQKGVAQILEAIYEQDFLDCSYGFRPNRSCHQVLNVVDKTMMRCPINYVIESDMLCKQTVRWTGEVSICYFGKCDAGYVQYDSFLTTSV